MAAKGVNGLVWDMFEHSGSLQYYLMYAAIRGRKSKEEERREEIERLTR